MREKVVRRFEITLHRLPNIQCYVKSANSHESYQNNQSVLDAVQHSHYSIGGCSYTPKKWTVIAHACVTLFASAIAAPSTFTLSYPGTCVVVLRRIGISATMYGFQKLPICIIFT